jgi:iron complex outermembrane recepter protein
VVTGDRSGSSYFAPNATTATKLDVPLRDVPASIQVIPRQLIEDKKIIRLNDLADYVSGVQAQSGYGGLSSQGYYFRGFETSFETFRNGFRDFGFLTPRDIANVERVEFLKGPASVLYGGSFGSIAGIVNTITKKPLADPFYQVSMTFGSYSLHRPAIDLSGPLTPDKSLLYRLNVAYENAGSYRDFIENESIFVAPALTWRIGPKTTVTFELEYQNFNYVFDRGLLPSAAFLNLPRKRFLGEPGFNRASLDALAITYNFEHNFSDNWKFRQGFNANLVSNFQQNVRGSRFSEPLLEADGRSLPRRAEREPDSDQKNFTLQNELFGKFKTGSIRHNLLFGVELSRYRFSYAFFRATIDALDIFNPVYGAKPGEFELAYSPENYGADNLGIYVQDLMELSPNLKLLAGLRFDSNDSFYKNEDGTVNQEQTDASVSPRLGLVYQPSDTTALYFSWSRSFNPQFFSRNRTGEPFEPETGEQFELGLKQDFLNKRLSLNLSAYQITKQNVLTADPEDTNFSIQTGEQKSRGVELDVIGQILPGLDIIATYAYTDAFVSEDNSIPVGETLVNAAKHRASVWMKYEIQSGNLSGLGFGVGVVFNGDRPIGLPNVLVLPSYIRADAALFYRRDRLRLSLNVRNLTNTKYQESQGNFYFIPAAPISVYGSISYQL